MTKISNVTSLAGSVKSLKNSPDALADVEVLDGTSACSVDSSNIMPNDNSSVTVCVGVGANNTLSDCRSEQGTAAPNIFGVNVNVAVESATGTSTVGSWNAVVVVQRMQGSVGDLVTVKSAEKGKKQPAGNETKGKMSGATGSGVTGLWAVNRVTVSGTEAHGHDLHTLTDVVRNSSSQAYYRANSNDTSFSRDHTITYAFHSFIMKDITNVQMSVSRKDGAKTSNHVCGESANMFVSSDVSEMGKALGHTIDPLIEVSSGKLGAARMFYSGVLIFEVEDNRVATVVQETSDHSKNGNTIYLANSLDAYQFCVGGRCTRTTYKNELGTTSQTIVSIIEVGSNTENTANKSKKNTVHITSDVIGVADKMSVEKSLLTFVAT